MKRLFTTSFCLLSLAFLVGCEKTAPSELTSSPTVGNDIDSQSNAANETSATENLRIPVLPPKPLVWLDDWKETEPSEVRAIAMKHARKADYTKASGAYGVASRLYNQAIEADPTYAYASYQLACNYELSGESEKAKAAFQNAVEGGFDDFPTAYNDAELGTLRDAPDFDATLNRIRERYLTTASERLGNPIAVRPSITRDSTPVMILLHGYGDTNLSYLNEARYWARSGYVAVALPGSIPVNDGFIWSMESFEPTHRAIQSVLDSEELAPLIDREQVYMLGFSQGALHALILTTRHPDSYAGVVAMSPGGAMSENMAPPKLSRSGRAKIAFIYGAEEAHAPIAAAYRNACRNEDWPFTELRHQGGHELPPGWSKGRRKVSAFLKRRMR